MTSDAFPLSRAVLPGLVVLDTAGSTNAELAERAGEWTAVVTLDQTAGRGRMGRTWSAPPGTALAVSVLLSAPPARLRLLPLIAGLAMTRAVRALVPDPDAVSLKWPNDVLVGDRKVSGLLAEVIGGDDVVMGAGLNLTMTREQLPVPTATSLVLAGADPGDLADRALAQYLTQLTVAQAEPDPVAAASAVCSTLGREVAVELPDGTTLRGRAQRLDADGALVIEGVPGPLSAGDVHHVR